jgi:2-dehydropantoate 2-reductase
MDKHIRICVVGPGAIGGVVAAILSRSGYPVELVVKYPELAKKISTRGIDVSGYCGSFTQIIPSVATCDELKGEFDYVLIATRGDALEDVAKAVLPVLKKDSRIVSMQNGICVDKLAEVVGLERAVGCVVGWGGNLLEPGKVRMNSGGECVLGNWKREPDEKLHTLAKIMEQVIDTRITGDILSELYSKLIINSCITTLGAICGMTLGRMLAVKKIRNMFIQIIREAVLVSDSAGIKIEKYAGKLDFYDFAQKDGLLDRLKKHLMIRIIGFKYRRLKSSSLQSLETGRKTEIDYLNGYICSKGRENGIRTPLNNKLVQLVKEIESGQRAIKMENFLELLTIS